MQNAGEKRIFINNKGIVYMMLFAEIHREI